jgi:hypothetical protein
VARYDHLHPRTERRTAVSPTTFTPGLKGGQRYGKTEDKEMTASTIKKLFSEIKCFLLPKHSAETDVAYKQQMSALLRLVLEQEPPIQTDEDGNAVKLIRTLLESLNAPLSTYTDILEAKLEWPAEPNFQQKDSVEDPTNSALLEKLILIFDETGMDHFDSVDEMFSKALLLAKSDGHVSQPKESSKLEGQIKAQLIQAFHNIHAYVESMDQVLEQNISFNGPEQLSAESNKIRIHLLNQYGNKLGPFLEVTQKKIAKAEYSYKKKRVASSPGSSSAGTSDETMELEEETENAQSQSQIPAQVGIHFGFNLLSAVALVDGSPRTVYGPRPNTISFAIFRFHEVFKNLDLDRKYYFSYGKYCRIEELVALVLARLHRVVVRSLHTNNIAYVIAFPSCFNETARTAMNFAVQIAGLNAKIVRDTCGLTAYFINDCYSAVFANSFKKIVFTIVENQSDESSDVVGYEMSNQVVSPVFLCGDYPPTWSVSSPLTFRSESKPGLFPLVEKIKKNPVYIACNKSAIRVILHCSGYTKERNTKIIKAAMPRVKVHFYSNSINNTSNLTVGKGAALLAGYEFNPKFSQDWDRDHPEITLRGFDQEIRTANNTNYRMMHYGFKMRAHQVSELSQKVQCQVDVYHRSLETEKSRGKTVYMEKSNQIQDSNMKQSDKNRASRDLSALLKEMDEEELSLSRVRDIIDRIENLSCTFQ